MAIVAGQPPPQPGQGFLQPMDQSQNMQLGLLPGQTPLTSNPGQQQGGGAAQQWAQWYAYNEFQKEAGRPPTLQELNQLAPAYAASGDPNVSNVSGGNQAVSAYYTQLLNQANAPSQEQKALQDQIPLIQNLINSQTQATAKDMTDPNSATYQSFSGMMNNMGITPSSGAYQAGVGSTLGSNAANSINAALGAVGLPLASGYAGATSQPFMSAMNTPEKLFDNNLQMQNFLTEAQFGQRIADQMKPSDLEKGFAMAGQGGQAIGGLAQAAGPLAAATYICTHLKNLGLATEHEVKMVHDRLYPTIVLHPFGWLRYWMESPRLIERADLVGVDWKSWKTRFIDDMMGNGFADQFYRKYRLACFELMNEVRTKECVYAI